MIKSQEQQNMCCNMSSVTPLLMNWRWM